MKQPFLNQKLLAISIPCIFGWIFAFLATNIFKNYALGLFIWLPFVLGASSTIIGAYKNPVPRRTLRNSAYWTLLVFCIGLLAFAWEGIICLLMAAPIGFACCYVGHLLAYAFLKTRNNPNIPLTILFLSLSVPAVMAFEDMATINTASRSVTTAVEINAPPDKVWKNVLSFPELPPPSAFVFRTGIAYPVNASISGHGIGAVRHCNFSTGSFVEPITGWQEPTLLQFSVDQQPEPMTEISWTAVHPNHLKGYWVSKKGQFLLIALPNGRTRLEGTTWYVNKIKPSFYWTIWSDYIVHKIHNRVLQHIKSQSEK